MGIAIGIYGHGNLGRGVEHAIMRWGHGAGGHFYEEEAFRVVPVTAGARVMHVSEALDMKNRIDVMILCGGSVSDLPEQTPELAKHFNVVDSFDTHANIPAHFEKVDAAAKSGALRDNFSRLGSGIILFKPDDVGRDTSDGCDYTFWGRVSARVIRMQ